MDAFIERFNLRKGRTVKGISRDALSALMVHDWPGNVRELENAIEHAFVLCRDDIIRVKDLPESLVPEPAGLGLKTGSTLREIERAAILEMLRLHKGKRVKTAKALGIDKNTLRRKMIRLRISGPSAGSALSGR